MRPLHTGNPKMGMLANSEEPDEMQHNVAFHQGLHFSAKFADEDQTCGPLVLSQALYH